MIYVLAIAVVFLGLAVCFLLSDAAITRQQHASERQRWLDPTRMPESTFAASETPKQLSKEERERIAMEVEQEQALQRVFAIVGTKSE